MTKVGLGITGEEVAYTTPSLSHRCYSASIMHTTKPPIQPGSL